MKEKATAHTAGHVSLATSGATASPSWNILKSCLLIDGLALGATAVAALIITDSAAALSVVAAAVLVMLFFGLSLFAAHVFGKRHPQALVSIFFASYFVKVMGFGAILFALGTPDWLNKPWFLGASIAAVVIWQAVEVVIFSKQRFLRFDDAPSAKTPDTTTTPEEGSAP